MKRLKVAHLIATNFFGGPEKQILEHGRRLQEGDCDFCLVSFREGPENQILERALQQGIEGYGIRQRHPFDLAMVGELNAYLRTSGVDLLVTHHYKANIVGRLASLRSGLPVIAVSRGWTAESRKIRLYEGLDKRFLRYADHVVAVSDGQRRKVLALGVAPERVSVIRNCIDTESPPPAPGRSAREELRLAADALLVASAGRLSPEKNYGGMIRVARKVAHSEPRAVFAVFGEGFLRDELERSVREAGLEGRFLLPGFRGDFTAILPEIDVFVLPSFTEGLPNVVLEAFAARRPVVATAVGGTPEVVTDGESGFLVAPEEEERMAQAVLELLRSPDLRARMGESGFAHIRKHFCPVRQTEAYRDLYRTVASRRRAEVVPGRGAQP